MIWSVTGLALGALYALWTNHLLAARTCAQGQVTLILWGWAFAQFPVLVEPNLTIYNAAAPLITQRMLVGLLIVGGLVLMPSFRYLLIVFESHPRHLRRGTNPLH